MNTVAPKVVAWFKNPAPVYRLWKRRLRQRHRWLFEAVENVWPLLFAPVYIIIGALGLIEVTTRDAATGKGKVYPYFLKAWEWMGGFQDFTPEEGYEIWYWTAWALLLFGLFLLYAMFQKDKDTAYEDGQPTATTPIPAPAAFEGFDPEPALNDIAHVLHEVHTRSVEEWAEEMNASGDFAQEYVLWRRVANVYKALITPTDTLDDKRAVFHALCLYIEGTRRPRGIIKLIEKEGLQITHTRVREIIAAYEAERDRLFLRL